MGAETWNIIIWLDGIQLDIQFLFDSFHTAGILFHFETGRQSDFMIGSGHFPFPVQDNFK